MQSQLQQIDPILQAVTLCVQYPEDSPALAPQGYKEKQDWEATYEIMLEQRGEFFQLFKNVAKLQPEKTTAFLRQQLEQKLTSQSTFQVDQIYLPMISNVIYGTNIFVGKRHRRKGVLLDYLEVRHKEKHSGCEFACFLSVKVSLGGKFIANIQGIDSRGSVNLRGDHSPISLDYRS